MCKILKKGFKTLILNLFSIKSLILENKRFRVNGNSKGGFLAKFEN